MWSEVLRVVFRTVIGNVIGNSFAPFLFLLITAPCVSRH